MEDVHIKNEEIINKIKANDMSLAEELIIRYDYFIKNIIVNKFYIYPGNDYYEDLLQEGYIRIIKCAKEYDQNKGASFNTYLYKSVLRQLDRKLSELVNIIHIPYYNHRLMVSVNQYKKENEIQVNKSDIMNRFSLTDSEYDNLVKCYTSVLSLNTPLNIRDEASDTTLEDIIPDSRYIEYDKVEDDDVVNKVSVIAKSILSPIEYSILKLRGLFDENEEPLTYLEIGNLIHLTKQRCHQLSNHAKEILAQNNSIRKLLGQQPIITTKGGKARDTYVKKKQKVIYEKNVVDICYNYNYSLTYIKKIIYNKKKIKKIS